MKANSKKIRSRVQLSPLPFHYLADLFPLMSASDFDALVEDIRANGIRVPITLFEGKVLDGRNRIRACEAAGVEPIFEVFQGTEDDALSYVLSLNLVRRHLCTTQKAALGVQLLPREQKAARGRKREAAKDRQNFAGAQGKATDVVGARVGVSGETVRQAAWIADSTPDVYEAMRDGVVRTMPEAARLTVLNPEERGVVLSKMRDGGLSFRDSKADTTYWDRPGSSTEWYSPPEILDAARAAMGGAITLDPASSKEANKIVGARRYYTVEEDGLSLHWKAARLWLNPPYGCNPDGTSLQAAWTGKLLEEFKAGKTRQAVALVRASTESYWFSLLWEFPMCFVRGKIEFTPGPGAKPSNPTVSSAIVGVGVDAEAFRQEFQAWGQVVVPAKEGGGNLAVGAGPGRGKE